MLQHRLPHAAARALRPRRAASADPAQQPPGQHRSHADGGAARHPGSAMHQHPRWPGRCCPHEPHHCRSGAGGRRIQRRRARGDERRLQRAQHEQHRVRKPGLQRLAGLVVPGQAEAAKAAHRLGQAAAVAVGSDDVRDAQPRQQRWAARGLAGADPEPLAPTASRLGLSGQSSISHWPRRREGAGCGQGAAAAFQGALVPSRRRGVARATQVCASRHSETGSSASASHEASPLPCSFPLRPPGRSRCGRTPQVAC
mmetsp:Transcript_9284/g.36280  ORF Transcript_9284/g.36280 Transcript_9284/m.36280 type:complete len:256 (-) Transcript_9284:120-887(-)